MRKANLGKEFERELEGVHDLYRARGLADIVRNPNEWEFTGAGTVMRTKHKLKAGMFAKTPDGRYLIRRRSDVDFSGGGKGFSICFDAKSTEGTRFSWDAVKPHQIHRLKVSAKCGTIAGLMVKIKDLNLEQRGRSADRVFFVPIGFAAERFLAWAIQKKAKPGTASLSIADLEANAIEIKKGFAPSWDWLKPVLEAHGV